jgi:hypothetical protein
LFEAIERSALRSLPTEHPARFEPGAVVAAVRRSACELRGWPAVMLDAAFPTPLG